MRLPKFLIAEANHESEISFFVKKWMIMEKTSEVRKRTQYDRNR